MQKLPKPANGDIFAFGGTLTISNAASNVFIIHDTRPESASLLPSSLSVDFVMENVYHIDASLFSHHCSALVGGTLIKGLGLQAEGCRLGDTYVETVYDDIVCVVSDQADSSCTIGSIAGDLISVVDPENPWKDPKLSHNFTVACVVGQSSNESCRAHEGGLAKALSIWSSLMVPPSQPAAGHEVAIARDLDLGGDENTMMLVQLPSELTESDPKTHVGIHLLHALSERDEARRELADWKRPSLDPQHELALPQAERSHPEDLVLTEAQHNQLSTPVPSAMVCGNCGRSGHEVRDCIGPVDDQGFIAACPICNTTAHGFDSCPDMPTCGGKKKRKWARFEYLIRQRVNKAPIKSNSCWIATWVREGMPFILLPHTRQFSLKLAQNSSTTPHSHPDWRTFEYNGGCSDTSDKLVQDPDTALLQGKPCTLVPGSQCSKGNKTGYSSITQKMQSSQIRVLGGHPDTKNDSAQPQKQPQPQAQRQQQGKLKQFARRNKKQYARYLPEEDPETKVKKEAGGIPSFATGANCTVMSQRPLPALLTREPLPTIKKEPESY